MREAVADVDARVAATFRSSGRRRSTCYARGATDYTP